MHITISHLQYHVLRFQATRIFPKMFLANKSYSQNYIVDEDFVAYRQSS